MEGGLPPPLPWEVAAHRWVFPHAQELLPHPYTRWRVPASAGCSHASGRAPSLYRTQSPSTSCLGHAPVRYATSPMWWRRRRWSAGYEERLPRCGRGLIRCVGGVQASTVDSTPGAAPAGSCSPPGRGASFRGEPTVVPKPKRGRKGQKASRGHKPLAPPRLPEYRGPGQPTDLNRETLESICEALATGMSQKRVARLHFLNPDTFYAWRARGVEDKAAGKDSIYVEFSDRAPAGAARGEWFLRSTIHEAIRVALPPPSPGGKRQMVDVGQATQAIKAGDLALRALLAQESGRRGAAKRWGAPGTPAPLEPPPAPRVDLSRLSDGDAAMFRQLVRKLRGEE
jgi:hypothetical protein